MAKGIGGPVRSLVRVARRAWVGSFVLGDDFSQFSGSNAQAENTLAADCL
jgi:hypothetical protein